MTCYVYFQSGMIQNGREGIFIEPVETRTLINTTFGRHKLASCGLVQAPPIDIVDIGQLPHRYLILFEKHKNKLSCHQHTSYH